MEAVEDQTHNGWKNYPTWAVNLWLSNDEGLYHQTRELVASAKEDHDEEFVGIETADALKDFVQELAGEAYSEASFVTDLLGYALDQVDWREIAAAWLDATD